MSLFLNEHGEAILYGIIGTLMVISIVLILNSRWKKITPDYNLQKSPTSKSFVTANKPKCPKIDADNVIYAEYKDDGFVIKDHINAKDYDGSDLSDKVKIYDNIDVNNKGIYRAKCVVKNDNNLMSIKYISVVVE